MILFMFGFRRIGYCVSVLLLFFNNFSYAGNNMLNTEYAQVQNIEKELPSVYLDCRRCDFDYVRQELDFVNYVRDPEQADIHVFVTDQSTGDGGRMYEFSFIGRNNFSGTSFLREHTTKRDATSDEVRKELTSVLQQGFASYMLQTNEGSDFLISYDQPSGLINNGKAVHDPWNNWVFEAYIGSIRLNKQSNRSDFHSRWGIFADRVTDDWKFRLRPYFNYDQRKIRVSDDEEPVVSTVFRSGFDSHAIMSLGDHWSTGVFGSYQTNNSRNIKHEIELMPGIEYSLLPYEEAIRKSFTLRYQVGYSYVDYFNETVFDKTQESLFMHRLRGNVDISQPWGNIRTGFLGSHYFHDTSRRRVEVYGRISVRVLEGLSLSFQADYSVVHDQLSLPKGEATIEEVLMQQRELATNYNFSTMIAITYLFGSKYANIVNTRF
jgi:hypothetical protein